MINLSDTTRSIEDYVRRYADDYCNGDIEEAMNHILVKVVIEEKENCEK